MPDTINLGGMKLNKNTMWISLAAAGGILGYAWWSRRGGIVPSSDTGSTDTSTDTTGEIDPATGLPYGEDFSGIPQYQGIGFYDPTTGQTIGTGYGGTVTQVTTNAAWTQAVVAYLTAQGYEGTKVTDAIGKVLAGRPVTDDEFSIFSAATAAQGNPPQGYPPIVHVPATTPPTNPAGTTPKAPTGLKATSVSKSSVTLDWSPLGTVGSTPGFVGYQVYMNGARQVTLSYSGKWTKHFLKPNTSYRFTVYGVYRSPGANHDSLGPGASITVRTKK